MKSIQLIIVMLLCPLAYSQEDTTSEALSISSFVVIDTNVYVYPPELIISIPPPIIDWGWFEWGLPIFVFLMPERLPDDAQRIFAYAESPSLAFESVQIGNKLCTRFEAKEDQVIRLKLRMLGDNNQLPLAYQHLSIPIRIKKGFYEFSSNFERMLNATYLLSIETESGTEVSRIETYTEGDPNPYESKAVLNDQAVMENIKIIHL